MKIPFAVPNIKEEDAEYVKNILLTQTRLTDGEQCRKFEEEFRKYIGAKYCLAVSSCMAALHLAYLVLGIREGDEVIVPAMTHVATVHAVELVGAVPVFVDCNSVDGNINIYQIEKNITNKTKAISLVHFLGMPCNIKKIIEIAENYDLKVIEDCALSLGAGDSRGNHTGTLSDVGCFSFYPCKHITTGEGGMFVTNDRYIYERAKSIRSFGKSNGSNYRYDIDKLGLNYRMSELQAALGVCQMQSIENNLQKRKHNFYYLYFKINRLDRNIRGIIYNDTGTKAYYCLGLIFRNNKIREKALEIFARKGIGCSIYYPNPVNRLTYYRDKYGFRKINFKNAIEIADCSVALPVGQHLTNENLDYIIETIEEI